MEQQGTGITPRLSTRAPDTEDDGRLQRRRKDSKIASQISLYMPANTCNIPTYIYPPIPMPCCTSHSYTHACRCTPHDWWTRRPLFIPLVGESMEIHYVNCGAGTLQCAKPSTCSGLSSNIYCGAIWLAIALLSSLHKYIMMAHVTVYSCLQMKWPPPAAPLGFSPKMGIP
jgi:hypothetical protein